VAQKVQTALNDHNRSVKGSRIHLLGVAYKKDVSDTRESPALDLLVLLDRMGASLSYSDPHVPRFSLEDRTWESQPALTACIAADCVVLATNHSQFDYAAIAAQSRLIVDTRNAFRDFRSPHIVRL
jgi:UDP-N-acetyl-D-glucosamine dehydrogenase